MFRESYWKYAAISSDNGRRISIFDCDNWELVGKLRFESSTTSSKLEMTLDATARFLFITDYDASVSRAYLHEYNFINFFRIYFALKWLMSTKFRILPPARLLLFTIRFTLRFQSKLRIMSMPVIFFLACFQRYMASFRK